MFRRSPTAAAPHHDARRHDPAAEAWNPAQVIALGIGVGYLLLGLAGVARTGVPLAHLDRPYADVVGFRHSPLLGLAELGVGALLVVAGLVAGGARSLMMLLGTLITSFGVMLLVDIAPGPLHHWSGVAGPYGWLSVIVGVFLMLTARFLPDVTPQDRAGARGHVVT
jgi:hypothetical protein